MKKKIVIGLWVSLFILIIAFWGLVLHPDTIKNLRIDTAEKIFTAEESTTAGSKLKVSDANSKSDKKSSTKTNKDRVSKKFNSNKESKAVEKEEYTFTSMEETYYAKSKATVRQEPSDTAEVLGTLSLDQRVEVVGKCKQTEYFKIKINGDFGYVATDNLSESYIPIPLPISSAKSVPTATKDILFIGNSITMYPATKDWWGSGWGCGATAPENDYVHLTVATKGYSSFDFMSLRAWEFSNTRNNELDDLDPYITKYQYGTIVIELGENVKGHEGHFKEDLSDMITYIKTYNPNARIVMLDNFWPYKSIIATKKAVAEENGITYVSLADIQGAQEYMLQAGDQFTTPDGTVYTINSFLAGHPNDAGFLAIAQRLSAAL